ncbi:hypothetical protein L1987_60136 [Smallanthus sonchifolius]|uniref:Uncharacterized protein n=1 Tax=Smallanthus sonchifolius TaxID=185202 RepID=A0ACB9D7M3_9ASTR|nr:hypothetical protein L1987_60136 [Smallanthus sonchifolius]
MMRFMVLEPCYVCKLMQGILNFTSPHKRGIRNGPKDLKPIPVIIHCNGTRFILNHTRGRKPSTLLAVNWTENSGP